MLLANGKWHEALNKAWPRTGVGDLSLAAGQNYNLQGLSGPYKFTINSVVVKACEFMKL